MAQRGGVCLLGIIIGDAGQGRHDFVLLARTQKTTTDQRQVSIYRLKQGTGIVGINMLMIFCNVNVELIV